MLLHAGVSKTPVMTVFYLHGFASSPQSTKVQYFTRMLSAHGLDVRCPDLNQPDFRTLTMTRMLEQLGRDIEATDGPVALMGSSLGGVLAVFAAARWATRVDRVVLFAPAVMFGDPSRSVVPSERLEEWKGRGELEFNHHGYGGTRLLAYAFYEDSLKYDTFGTLFPQPTLIFQGLRDPVVDHREVERFATTRANVTLTLVDDDHQLIASLPRIWSDVQTFLGLK